MAIPSNQLFLDRFIEYNVERYQDNPSFVQTLQGLTLATVSLTNLREVTLEGGQLAHLYDIDMPGVFTGKNQMFYPADYIQHKVAVFEEPDPVTPENLELKGTAGIYKLAAGGGSALVLNGKKDNATVLALIKEKCLYDLIDSQIVISQDISSVTINSPTVVGTLGVAESLFDGIQRYNGQYRADGSISAL